MIARFWDALFDYGDMLREQKRFKEHETLEDIYTMLQTVYDNGISCEKVITDKEPESDLEKFVLSIKDIIVYLDEQDGSYYYDLDGHHFDTPQEVMNYLVDCRMKLQINAINKVKREMLGIIATKIDGINVPSVIGSKSPKTVVKKPIDEVLTYDYLKRKYIDEDKSMRQIAILLRCSESTIYKYVKKYGLDKGGKK